MTSAGQMQDRFAFLEVTTKPNGQGGIVSGHAERFVVAARREGLRGAESVQAARLAGRQPIKLTIRAFSGSRRITPEWQARDARSGTVYDIKSVTPSEDRAWIELECELA